MINTCHLLVLLLNTYILSNAQEYLVEVDTVLINLIIIF